MVYEVGSNFDFISKNYLSKTGICLEGGSRSGKTWDTIAFICWYVNTHTGKVITIGRDKLTVLRKTLLVDWQQIAPRFGITELNRSEMNLTYNGNLIRFVGLNDDIMAAHGLTQDIFWVNESMSISRDTFDQLEQRTADFWILDYNPSSSIHWLYDLEKREDTALHRSTVLDNPFAPRKVREKILSYEPTERNKELGTADSYKWKVYGLGIRAQAEETVFKQWQYFDEAPEQYDFRVLGLDFGYSNDPSALIECIIDGNNLYLTELLYEAGKTNPDLAKMIKPYVGNDTYVVADSAEPKSIAELIRADIPVIAAQKGQGSVSYGIDKLKSYKLWVNKKSVNLQNEFVNYKFKKDDKTGRVLNQPVDEWNHLIDAARYAITKFNL